jgi:hypothetical protein
VHRFTPHLVFLLLVGFAFAWSVPAAYLAPLPDPDADYNTAGFLVRHSWVKFARVATSPLREELSEPEKDARVARFFELNERIAELDRRAGDPEPDAEQASAAAADAKALRDERQEIENSVEEIIEGRLTAVLEDAGLTRRVGWDFVWPPVNIEFEGTPSLLVESPRAEIRRDHDRLLQGDLATDDRVRLESEAESDGKTSALVVDIGAIAMYPAIIPPRTDYRSTLRTIAHEWVHHYLYFTPLGRSFYDSDKLVTLNETVANVAGDELGDIVWSRYPLERPPALVSARPMSPNAETDTHEAFDYRAEMHELRLEVDALLAEGRIEEAEALMEDRRQEFVLNGYYIRRINQAYFAFHGSYADSPASSDPIGPKMLTLRDRSVSIEAFLETVRKITSEAELDRYLAASGR